MVGVVSIWGMITIGKLVEFPRGLELHFTQIAVRDECLERLPMKCVIEVSTHTLHEVAHLAWFSSKPEGFLFFERRKFIKVPQPRPSPNCPLVLLRHRHLYGFAAPNIGAQRPAEPVRCSALLGDTVTSTRNVVRSVSSRTGSGSGRRGSCGRTWPTPGRRAREARVRRRRGRGTAGRREPGSGWTLPRPCPSRGSRERAGTRSRARGQALRDGGSRGSARSPDPAEVGAAAHNVKGSL